MKHRGIAPNERIHTLDIIRGIAILGIVLANMMHFKSLAQLNSFIFVDGHQLPDGLFNQFSTLFITFFVEGKFYPMFSLLFGLGFYIFYERLLQKDLRANRVFSRRLTFLIILGLIHLIFFWHGDILFTYGVTGFFLLFFISRHPKTMMIWSVVLLAVSSLVVSFFMAMNGWFMQFGEQTGIIPASEFQEMNEETLTVMAEGGFWEIVGFRFSESIFTVFGNIFVVPTILPLFLIGLYMGKTGMFHDVGAHLGRWKKICIHSLWIGLLFSVLTTAMMHDLTPIPAYIAYGLGFGMRIFTGPILMLFYVSALVLLLRKETRQKIMKPFASVGRMALTNYLMQTLILVFIFHGYGLGLFGQVGSGAGLLISVGVYVLQIIISTLYLKTFNQGPMEALWRKWTYKNV
ncbi:DUF418 domain-containing protein [Salicibibacter cibi]|uniref:DUF418 domain-containing protein n=1 Tax=Salicibibacter cibi TaxID=2743001 RepID=A0A7T6ZC13_9BACI|nr:DUF418 domain-containing protein [Salicibibacter cibi]QQK80683.1 DUF418 domain-containing protein [Salicibibacter cibi]